MKAIFKSHTGLNFFEAMFLLLLNKCSLMRRSLSFSSLNLQITYMIFIYSQSLKKNIVLEDPPLECVSIGCHKTKLKVITAADQRRGKHHTIQWEPKEKISEQLFAELNVPTVTGSDINNMFLKVNCKTPNNYWACSCLTFNKLCGQNNSIFS